MRTDATYAEVIPLIRLPRSLGIFDYSVPTSLVHDLAPGVLVTIPFRGRRVAGVVLKLKKEASYAPDKLESVVAQRTDAPLISPTLLQTYVALATEYCVSPALLLRTILPDIPKRVLPFRVETSYAPRGITVPRMLVGKITEGLSASLAAHDVLLHIDDARIFYALINRLALEAYKTGRHLRILSSRRGDAITIAHFLNQYGLPAARVLPTDSASHYLGLWRALDRGEVPVVVGTRAALFLPLPSESTVMLLDEDSDDWKQGDINPRYDARTLLPRLLEEKSHRILVSQSIRPELASARAAGTLRYVDIRTHDPAEVTILNMRDHVRSGAKNTLSDALVEALKGSERALLFTHRKGKGSVLLCRDCQFLFRCALCEVPLGVHRTFLRCSACTERVPLPLTCPSCKGSRLASIGTGTERVEDELSKLFPGTPILRVDSENRMTDIALGERMGARGIVVGTQTLLAQFGSASREPFLFDLIAIIDADTALHRSDFRSHEKLARILTQLGHLAARAHAPLLIQTAFPDLSLWKIPRGNDDPYLVEELRERESLHYPPSWRLIKIIIQNKDRATLEGSAHEVKNGLIAAVRAHPEVEVIGPYSAVPPKVRGRYHELILVRFPPKLYAEIKPHVCALPDDVIVDLDTLDILR
ncbi:hypothetical protein HY478_00970 [Candidatus Uhrbacteria bacterium]|nr:hypothetical protein [Candidatus Uhrbacteria bacterium]